MQLNPGIRRTVQLLNDLGFETCDSGDGVTHDAECDRDHPYVVMHVHPAKMMDEVHRLLRELKSRGVEFSPESADFGPALQVNYSPVDGMAFIDLVGVDDALLGSATRIM